MTPSTSLSLVPTPSQTIGPFLAIGMEPFERPCVVPSGAPGAFTLSGSVRDGDDAPVPDAMVELWQAGPDGQFSAGAGADGTEPWFGRSLTDVHGGYTLTTVKPQAVPLRSGARQAPHLELLVFARGLLRPVRTRVYFPDEEAANDADPVLRAVPPQRRGTLLATASDDGYRFDVRLQGPGETVFFAC